MTPFWSDMPLRIERFTLLSWAIPAARLAPFIPAPLRLETILLPNQPEQAFLSVFVGRVRIQTFGLAWWPLSHVTYRTSVRYQNKLGAYPFRSVIDSSALAATARRTMGLSVHQGRLRVRWEESGRVEVHGDEIQLAFEAERAAFTHSGARLSGGALDNTLCPNLTYWTRRDGKLSMAKVEHPRTMPLSGRIETIYLPWLQEMGLLSLEEMQQPHSIFFVSRLSMKGLLSPAEEQKLAWLEPAL
jgi:Uncharacterized conserved protein (COG2071)